MLCVPKRRRVSEGNSLYVLSQQAFSRICEQSPAEDPKKESEALWGNAWATTGDNEKGDIVDLASRNSKGNDTINYFIYQSASSKSSRSRVEEGCFPRASLSKKVFMESLSYHSTRGIYPRTHTVQALFNTRAFLRERIFLEPTRQRVRPRANECVFLFGRVCA